MLRWLSQIDEPITEPEFSVLKVAEAPATEGGQVLGLPGDRTIYDLNEDMEVRLAAVRKKLWAEEPREALLERVRSLAGIRPLKVIPTCIVEEGGATDRNGYQLRKLVFAIEPNLKLPAYALVPKQRSGDTLLFVGGSDGKVDAFADQSEWAEAARAGHLVVAIDVRGLGELRPSSLATPNWYRAFLLEKSFVGMWAEGILAVARWAASYQSATKDRPVRVIGVGIVTPAVLHAAVLEPTIFSKVELRQSLHSWSDAVHRRVNVGHLFTMVYGALTVYDLPDLVRVLPQAKIDVVDARDSDNRPVTLPAR